MTHSAIKRIAQRSRPRGVLHDVAMFWGGLSAMCAAALGPPILLLQCPFANGDHFELLAVVAFVLAPISAIAGLFAAIAYYRRRQHRAHAGPSSLVMAFAGAFTSLGLGTIAMWVFAVPAWPDWLAVSSGGFVALSCLGLSWLAVEAGFAQHRLPHFGPQTRGIGLALLVGSVASGFLIAVSSGAGR